MIQKVLTSFILILISLQLFAQSSIETQNRAVYNRIEYFFNTQQTDSIYALASESFKTQINFARFEPLIQYYYQFGNITDAKAVTINNGTIGYNLSFPSNTTYLQLTVDSTYKFNVFSWHSDAYVLKDVKEIKSNATTTTALDFLVDSIAKTYLTNGNTASLAIGIIHNNKVNTFFYGETNKADKTSLPTANSTYEIGSISKVFTSILLADLVEKNIISLDDSIAKYLPDSVKNNPFLQKITFKQLANHTSGLPRLPSNFGKEAGHDPNNPYKHYSRKELYGALKNIQLSTEPGDNYEYSNLAYGLLSDLISIITKKSYEQNIKEIITTPLMMTSTTEHLDTTKQKLVHVYNESGKQVLPWDFQALTGTGSLKSTVNDLLRFAQYQFKMPESTLENAMALTRQFTYYVPPTRDIGLAWNMNMSNDVITYWHNGATGGSSSFIAIIPDSKSAIIVLSNAAHSVDDISLKIVEKVLTEN